MGKPVHIVSGRNYLPSFSQWLSIDPMAKERYWLSPYNYVQNSPFMRVDPNGRLDRKSSCISSKEGVFIVFSDYMADGWSNTGHDGVLLINNKTGLTNYYEFGRYGDGNGRVRNHPVPNVKIVDGKIDQASLNKTLASISSKSGHNGKIEGAYIRSENFSDMYNLAYRKWQSSQSIDVDMGYSIFTNNCGTFAHKTKSADRSIRVPSLIDPRPVSNIEEYQLHFPSVKFDTTCGTRITEIKGNVPEYIEISSKVKPK